MNKTDLLNGKVSALEIMSEVMPLCRKLNPDNPCNIVMNAEFTNKFDHLVTCTKYMRGDADSYGKYKITGDSIVRDLTCERAFERVAKDQPDILKNTALAILDIDFCANIIAFKLTPIGDTETKFDKIRRLFHMEDYPVVVCDVDADGKLTVTGTASIAINGADYTLDDEILDRKYKPIFALNFNFYDPTYRSYGEGITVFVTEAE